MKNTFETIKDFFNIIPKYLKVIIMIVVILIASLFGFLWFNPIPTTGTETWYMCSDEHTINGLSTYRLNETQTSTSKYVYVQSGMAGETCYISVRVYIRDSSGNEQELTSSYSDIEVSFTSNGLYSDTWTPPETELSTTDAILLKVFLKTESLSYEEKASFITNQLGKTKLDNTEWTVYVYGGRTQKTTFPQYTRCYFYWGSSSYQSRVENVKVTTGEIIFLEVKQSTTIEEQDCIFYSRWNASNGYLSYYIFGNNASGSWINSTEAFPSQTTETWVNKTVELPSANSLVRYQWWANDTNGNWATSGELNFTVTKYNTWNFQAYNWTVYNNEGYKFTENSTWLLNETKWTSETNYNVQIGIKPFKIYSNGTSESLSSDKVAITTISNGTDAVLLVNGTWNCLIEMNYSALKIEIWTAWLEPPSWKWNNTCTFISEPITQDVTITYMQVFYSIRRNSSGFYFRFGQIQTSYITMEYHIFEGIPYIFKENFGSTHGGYLKQNIFYNATETGGKAAIYVCYMNSSFEPWHYYVKAFDTNTRIWTEPYDLGEAPASDGHWSPAINVMPDGRLMFTYAYYTKIKYRISTYNASTETNLTKLISNWGSLQESFDTQASYTRLVVFTDKMLVFYRKGVTIEGNITFAVWDNNQEQWENETILAYFNKSETSSGYFTFTYFNNTVMIGFIKHNTTGNFNVYFVYSDDKGVTWKNDTGNVKTLPIEADEDLKIHSETNVWRIRSTFIDENNKVTLWYSSRKDASVTSPFIYGKLKVCVYSKGLGENGTWNTYECTDIDGNVIKGMHVYFNKFYQRPALITNDNISKKVIIYVRVPNKTKIFRKVWSESSANICTSTSGIIVNGYRFEMIYKEDDFGVIGTYNALQFSNKTDTEYIYGSKFIATQNSILTGIWQTFNFTAVNTQWKAAVYNSTFDLLGETDMVYYSGHRLYGTFNETLSVIEGETYWLCFRSSYSNGLPYYYNESSIVNSTFYFYESSGSTNMSFPDSINPTEFKNWTVCIWGYRSDLVVRGIGRILPTKLYVGWNNFSPWNEDINKTLGVVNASLQFDNINFTHIVLEYSNGTRVGLVYENGIFIGFETAQVQSSNDEFWIYCLEAGEWLHTYD